MWTQWTCPECGADLRSNPSRRGRCWRCDLPIQARRTADHREGRRSGGAVAVWVVVLVGGAAAGAIGLILALLPNPPAAGPPVAGPPAAPPEQVRPPAPQPPPAFNRPVPPPAPPPHPVDRAVADLAEPDRARAALQQLAGKVEDKASDRSRALRVADALARFPIDRHPELADLYLGALANWAMVANKPYVLRLSREPADLVNREKEIRLCTAMLRAGLHREALARLALLVVVGSPYPEAENLLARQNVLQPDWEIALSWWIFHPDPAYRVLAEDFFRSRGPWKSPNEADHRLFAMAAGTVLRADPERARVAVSLLCRIRDDGPNASVMLSELFRNMATLIEQDPSPPYTEALAAVLARRISENNSGYVLSVLGARPRNHPAELTLFRAATRFPNPRSINELLGWLDHPQVGLNALENVLSSGIHDYQVLIRLIDTSPGEQRVRYQNLLFRFSGLSVQNPTLKPILAELRYRRADEISPYLLKGLDQVDPNDVIPSDRAAVVEAIGRLEGYTSLKKLTNQELCRQAGRWAGKNDVDLAGRMIASRGATDDVSPLIHLVARSGKATYLLPVIRSTVNPINHDAAVAAVTTWGSVARPSVERLLADRTLPAPVHLALCRMAKSVASDRAVPDLEWIRLTYTDRNKPEFEALIRAAGEAVAAIRARTPARKSK